MDDLFGLSTWVMHEIPLAGVAMAEMRFLHLLLLSLSSLPLSLSYVQPPPPKNGVPPSTLGASTYNKRPLTTTACSQSVKGADY